MSVYCVGQVDQVLRADLAQQPGLAAEVLLGLVQRLLALVQAGEHGAAADLQAAAGQLVAQLGRVLRQEALRPELGPHVAGLRHLVEVLLPGHLVRVLREPHPPRVGCGTQASAGTGRCGAVIGVLSVRPRGSGRGAARPCAPRRSCGPGWVLSSCGDLGDRHVPPALRGRHRGERVGLDVDGGGAGRRAGGVERRRGTRRSSCTRITSAPRLSALAARSIGSLSPSSRPVSALR